MTIESTRIVREQELVERRAEEYLPRQSHPEYTANCMATKEEIEAERKRKGLWDRDNLADGLGEILEN